LGAASAVPTMATSRAPALALFDSNIPEARAFAKAAARKGIATIDVAGGDKALREIALRTPDVGGTIIGMTGWSDWVVLRGLMEEQGKRLRNESRIVHKGTRQATPFEWVMA
jgi:hypothetical protein